MSDPRNGHRYRTLCAWLRKQQLPCWLCGEAIDYTLKGVTAQRSPEGFTLDHVVPVSLGGTNSRENSRAAHRRCNSARGAGSTIKRSDNSRRW